MLLGLKNNLIYLSYFLKQLIFVKIH